MVWSTTKRLLIWIVHVWNSQPREGFLSYTARCGKIQCQLTRPFLVICRCNFHHDQNQNVFHFQSNQISFQPSYCMHKQERVLHSRIAISVCILKNRAGKTTSKLEIRASKLRIDPNFLQNELVSIDLESGEDSFPQIWREQFFIVSEKVWDLLLFL